MKQEHLHNQVIYITNKAYDELHPTENESIEKEEVTNQYTNRDVFEECE